VTDLIKRPTCATCKFFDRNDTAPTEGSCKENSPQLTVVMMRSNSAIGQPIEIPTPLAAWPNVGDSMWCGRYAAKWARLDS
jgi:hypothetical protein